MKHGGRAMSDSHEQFFVQNKVSIVAERHSYSRWQYCDICAADKAAGLPIAVEQWNQIMGGTVTHIKSKESHDG
jgi:hypothetical protein